MEAAGAAPGVLAVITHENAPKMRPAGVFKSSDNPPKAGGTTAPIFQKARGYWNGQPIAVVVAETFERARHAAGLVRVEYEEEAADLSMDGAGVERFRPKDLIGEEPKISVGHAEAALEASEVRVDHVCTTPRHNHNPIEPHAVVVAWEGGELRVHDSSQYIFGVRAHLADVFGLGLAEVQVTSPFVGGGFGTKGTAWPHFQIAAAAKVVGRPVKLPLTRQQMYACTGFRSATEQRVAIGADRPGGKLTALIHTGRSPSSATNPYVEPFTLAGRHLYSCPNMLFDQEAAALDTVAPTYMRAPGECPGTFALESAVDELAYALGMDPVELRLRNDPEVEAITGRPFSQRLLKEAYRLGAEKFGWSRRSAEPGSMRDGRFLVGMGVATAFYPVHQFPASARVRLMADGSALVQGGTHEMGMGTATVQAQHADDELGLPVERVRFEYGDTDLPNTSVTGGSSTTIGVGAAVSAAVAALKSELLKLAGRGSPLHGLKAEAVVFRDGALAPADGPGAGEPIVRRRPRPQLEDRPEPVHRRDHDGPGDGPDGGDPRRPPQRPGRQRQHRRVPRPHARRRPRPRSLLARRPRPAHADRGARHRRDRHHGRGGGGERRLPRHGGASPRPPDPPREADPRRA